MNILISGASGLIGTALVPYLKMQGHNVYTLKRNDINHHYNWDPKSGHIQLDPSVILDAAINLCGVNIGDKRWNTKRKLEIISSRVSSTKLLTETVAKLAVPPQVFINASAIGFYGDTGENVADENTEQGDNFLSEIVTQWENAAAPLSGTNIRHVFIRSGIVLSKKGGALKKMLLPFKLMLGGKIGTGKQYMSWISLTDELRAIEFLLKNDIHGPVNLTAPQPVNNITFTKSLGVHLRRPTLLPMPEFMVRILFSEMGEQLLLGSNRIKPQVLIENGFQFYHPTINSAFSDVLS